jgi:predicted protein tyrosine phosphatase
VTQPLRLLFICSRNQWRSRTAEEIFQGLPGIEVRSAGTSPQARIRVNEDHLLWADWVFVMEKRHAEILRERFPDAVTGCMVRCLQIEDVYGFMDEELVSLLKTRVCEHVEVA